MVQRSDRRKMKGSRENGLKCRREHRPPLTEPHFGIFINREAREKMYLVASVSHHSHAAVDIRGSALPIAAKSKEESLSVEGVCLCVK